MVSWGFLYCQLHLPAGRGCLTEAEIPILVEQSFSDLAYLQVAEIGTRGWGLTAGDLSFPVEREPIQVPVHHLQSTIELGQPIIITVKITTCSHWSGDDKFKVRQIVTIKTRLIKTL